MATAVYLVHYQHPRQHVRHAIRRVEAPAWMIRKLYRHLDRQPIDPLAKSAGIIFVLVRTWRGRGVAFESRLKQQKHHSRLCPVCNPAGYLRRTVRMPDN
jgi:hypothetical protein